MSDIERLDSALARIALLGCASTRRLEHAALAAVQPFTLMARAGDAVARLSLAVAPHAERIVVFAGPGNNGGDGIEAATRLAASAQRGLPTARSQRRSRASPSSLQPARTSSPSTCRPGSTPTAASRSARRASSLTTR